MKNKTDWTICMLAIATVLIVIIAGSIGTYKTLHPEKTKQEKLEAICKQYGHEFDKWSFAFVCKGYITFNFEPATGSGNYLWIRTCSICHHQEHRYSWSDKTPDATEAMVIVAKDEAIKACAEAEAKCILPDYSLNFYTNLNDTIDGVVTNGI